jgi:hypothetical protein
MKMSHHSRTRCQQRGISPAQVELILSYGQKYRRSGGAWEYRLRKRDKDKLISALKRQMQMIEKSVGKGVLISGDLEKVITTYPLLKKRLRYGRISGPALRPQRVGEARRMD